MMKFLHRVAVLLVAACSMQSLSAEEITLTEAGSLASTLGDKVTTISELTLAGPINDADFATLAEMGKENLKVLDLGAALPAGDSIPAMALLQANQITSLVLPETTKSIGLMALGGLSISSIELPATLEYIAPKAFRDPKGTLSSITLAEGNESFTLVDGILYSADKKTLVLCPPAREGVISVADGTIRIEDSAFDYCKKITSIKLPATVEELGRESISHAENLVSINLDNVKKIDYKAFEGCTSFKGNNGILSLPNTVVIGRYAFYDLAIVKLETSDALESIGESAFLMCKELTEVTLGKNLKEIGKSAFHADDKLMKVTCYAEVPPVIVNDYHAIYYKFEEEGTLYVPAGSIEAYKSANLWNKVSHIEAISGTTGIEDLTEADYQVIGTEGGILVKGNAPVSVRVFKVSGVLVKEQTLAGGNAQIALQKGIYFISLNGEKAKAIVVR